MSKRTDQAILSKYAGADSIYRLHRSKKLNGLQRALDFGTAIVTDSGGLYDEADSIKNNGKFYLINKDGEQILAYADRSGILEEIVTGKLEKKQKEFLYKGYRYAPNVELISGERFFHMLL